MKTRLADDGVLRRVEKDYQRWICVRWYLVALVLGYTVVQGRFLFLTALHLTGTSQGEVESLQITAAKITFTSGFLLALFITSLILQWQHHSKINVLLNIIKRSKLEAQPAPPPYSSPAAGSESGEA